jgi:hypothetical protein
MLKQIPKDYFDPTKGTLKLLWESEWRDLGVTQVRKTFLLSYSFLPSFWLRRLCSPERERDRGES